MTVPQRIPSQTPNPDHEPEPSMGNKTSQFRFLSTSASPQNFTTTTTKRIDALRRMLELESQYKLARLGGRTESSPDLRSPFMRPESKPPLLDRRRNSFTKGQSDIMFNAVRRNLTIPVLSITVPPRGGEAAVQVPRNRVNASSPKTKTVTFASDDDNEDEGKVSDESSICQSPSWEEFGKKKPKKPKKNKQSKDKREKETKAANRKPTTGRLTKAPPPHPRPLALVVPPLPQLAHPPQTASQAAPAPPPLPQEASRDPPNGIIKTTALHVTPTSSNSQPGYLAVSSDDYHSLGEEQLTPWPDVGSADGLGTHSAIGSGSGGFLGGKRLEIERETSMRQIAGVNGALSRPHYAASRPSIDPQQRITKSYSAGPDPSQSQPLPAAIQPSQVPQSMTDGSVDRAAAAFQEHQHRFRPQCSTMPRTQALRQAPVHSQNHSQGHGHSHGHSHSLSLGHGHGLGLSLGLGLGQGQAQGQAQGHGQEQESRHRHTRRGSLLSATASRMYEASKFFKSRSARSNQVSPALDGSGASSTSGTSGESRVSRVSVPHDAMTSNQWGSQESSWFPSSPRKQQVNYLHAPTSASPIFPKSPGTNGKQVQAPGDALGVQARSGVPTDLDLGRVRSRECGENAVPSQLEYGVEEWACPGHKPQISMFPAPMYSPPTTKISSAAGASAGAGEGHLAQSSSVSAPGTAKTLRDKAKAVLQRSSLLPPALPTQTPAVHSRSPSTSLAMGAKSSNKPSLPRLQRRGIHANGGCPDSTQQFAGKASGSSSSSFDDSYISSPATTPDSSRPQSSKGLPAVVGEVFKGTTRNIVVPDDSRAFRHSQSAVVIMNNQSLTSSQQKGVVGGTGGASPVKASPLPVEDAVALGDSLDAWVDDSPEADTAAAFTGASSSAPARQADNQSFGANLTSQDDTSPKSSSSSSSSGPPVIPQLGGLDEEESKVTLPEALELPLAKGEEPLIRMSTWQSSVKLSDSDLSDSSQPLSQGEESPGDVDVSFLPALKHEPLIPPRSRARRSRVLSKSVRHTAWTTDNGDDTHEESPQAASSSPSAPFSASASSGAAYLKEARKSVPASISLAHFGNGGSSASGSSVMSMTTTSTGSAATAPRSNKVSSGPPVSMGKGALIHLPMPSPVRLPHPTSRGVSFLSENQPQPSTGSLVPPVPSLPSLPVPVQMQQQQPPPPTKQSSQDQKPQTTNGSRTLTVSRRSLLPAPFVATTNAASKFRVPFKEAASDRMSQPVAKMLVECCSCRFFHDMPSRVYECMASPDAVVEDHSLGISGAITTMVKCPWCQHNMSTSCCAGYAAMIQLKERLH